MYHKMISTILLAFLLVGNMMCEDDETRLNESDKPVKVEIRTQNDGSQKIYRDGRQYFILGAGGRYTYIKELADAGGNSIRTWGVDDASEVLDQAHRNDMTVMLGLPLPSERHGFNYSNRPAVEAMMNQMMQHVEQYKNHPALLIWALGNELDLQYTNTEVWNVVNKLAGRIKQSDPNHLVTTVTADIDREKAQLIRDRAPNLDLLSVNIYGGISSLPQRLREYGWTKPYIVSEWGPTGHWEVSRTQWGAPIEQTSTQKADSYRERYEVTIASDTQLCVGSYVFLWGQKQEVTHTWYGLFTEDGEMTGGVEVMQYNWTGRWPNNLAPRISGMTLNGQSAGASTRLERGRAATAIVTATDPNNDALSYTWEVSAEGGGSVGGDFEARPQPIPNLVISQTAGRLVFEAPSTPGAYRVFVKIADGKSRVATANIPFYVD
jgi:hypothetical protein